MGCGASKNTLETVDDSVHVMLKHDKKAAQKAGKPVTGYVPRAEHPLLAAQNAEASNESKEAEAAPNVAAERTDNGTSASNENGTTEQSTKSEPVSTETST